MQLIRRQMFQLCLLFFFFQVKACCEHAITFVPKKSYEGSQLQNLVLEQAVASYIGHYTCNNQSNFLII